MVGACLRKFALPISRANLSLLRFWAWALARYTYSNKCWSRWWFQLFFICSTLFGEDFQFDEHIFQMGWNHQPVILYIFYQSKEITPNDSRRFSGTQAPPTWPGWWGLECLEELGPGITRLVSLNRPYWTRISGGYFRGGRLTRHEIKVPNRYPLYKVYREVIIKVIPSQGISNIEACARWFNSWPFQGSPTTFEGVTIPKRAQKLARCIWFTQMKVGFLVGFI